MIIQNDLNQAINAQIRQTTAKVELVNSSTEVINNSGTVVVAEGKNALDVNVKANGKNLFSPNYSDYVKSGAYLTKFASNQAMVMSFIDKDTTVDVSDIKVGFVHDIANVNAAYRWVMQNGVIGAKGNTAANGTTTLCPYIMVYPTTEETFNRLLARYDIQVEIGTVATAYAPYDYDTTGVEVYRYGKNLLDISTLPELNTNASGLKNLTVDIENNTFSFEVTIANYSNGVNMYAYLPVGTYYASGEVTTTSGLKCGVLIRDEAGNFVVNYAGSLPNAKFTVTTPQIYSFSYYRPYSSSVGDIVTYSNVMLEVGSNITEYEKYVEPEVIVTNEEGIAKGFTALTYMTLYAKDSNIAVNVECNCKFNNVIASYNHNDAIKNINIERLGEGGKFFGFGISQKLKLELADKAGEISLNNTHSLGVKFGAEDIEPLKTFPLFNIDDVQRNEKTNDITVIAYDVLQEAAKHTVNELQLVEPYTLEGFVRAAAALLGITEVITLNCDLSGLSIEQGANFEGTETIRAALDDVAEATQSIYFLNSQDKLVFARLDAAAEPALTIDKAKYFELTSKPERTITAIASVTELGDNVEAAQGEEGEVQYIKDNAFIALRDDIAELMEGAIAAIGGLSITPFELNWRGNYLLELGDKIAIAGKDDSLITSYLLNDTISYNGALSQKSSWSYEAIEKTATNPTTLTEALKQTFAKVDKANKQIEMLASESSANSSAIAQLEINTNAINASVTNIENKAAATDEEINELTKKVEAQITAEEVRLEVQSQLDNGVTKVTTGKGFAFNDEGLTIEDLNTDSKKLIKTTISNNGMKVNADNQTVLTANDEGVQAKDLHATTYLIIGKNSRFEDYGSRTACFWIGGNN